MKDDKVVQFVAKLVQLTKEGKLEWSAVAAPRGDGTGSAFRTTIDDKRLLVYRYEYEGENPDYLVWQQFGITTPNQLLLRREQTEPPPRRTTFSGTRLGVIGLDGVPVYTFPHVAGTSDLYDSASYAAAGVDDLVSKVLGESDEPPRRKK